MTAMREVIDCFGARLEERYGAQLLPGQRRALGAMARCRTEQSRQMQLSCNDCEHSEWAPHSCGHRLCPHCQQHESQRWLDRQLSKRVPSSYYLLTFTVPSELRQTAYRHQRLFYNALMRCAWETLKTFTANDKRFKGTAGAVSVLHTHSRRLDYHPHVHVVMPAAAVDSKHNSWRSEQGKGQLFAVKALSKVFRAKMLAALDKHALLPAERAPARWVVHCKHVGRGEQALLYLGRYLYKGVVQEKDIIAVGQTHVTFRYTDSQTGKTAMRTLPGEDFLRLLLKHVLPKGFRRARNHGFLHPNSRVIARLQATRLWQIGGSEQRPPTQRPAWHCPDCGGEMRIVASGVWRRPPVTTIQRQRAARPVPV